MSTTVGEPRPGRLRRFVTSLSQSKSDLHAEQLKVEVLQTGATQICNCIPGEPVTVSGVLRSVTLRPREGVPAVEAELFDGTGRVLVVWLGRRRIHGVEPGRGIVVTGRMTCNSEKPTIFNPRYELRPPTAGAA